MSQSEKSAYFKALKDAGISFDKHYREYSTEDLKQAYVKLTGGELKLGGPPPAPAGAEDSPPAEFFGLGVEQTAPVAPRNPDEMAGQRLNAKPVDVPIRTDEHGRVWFQEEVLKPAYPKPRGRRVLTYTDTGTQEKTVKNGDYIESFEVAGDGPGRTAEIKITLPSYQVGIYKDRRFPFRVHTYNSNEGFDLYEVQSYYGGPELVPASIKRKYVENVLCYDIRTTIQTIQSEYRQLQLAGKV